MAAAELSLVNLASDTIVFFGLHRGAQGCASETLTRHACDPHQECVRSVPRLADSPDRPSKDRDRTGDEEWVRTRGRPGPRTPLAFAPGMPDVRARSS